MNTSTDRYEMGARVVVEDPDSGTHYTGTITQVLPVGDQPEEIDARPGGYAGSEIMDDACRFYEMQVDGDGGAFAGDVIPVGHADLTPA